MKNQIKEFLTLGYGFDFSVSVLLGFGLYSLYQNIVGLFLGLLTGGIDLPDARRRSRFFAASPGMGGFPTARTATGTMACALQAVSYRLSLKGVTFYYSGVQSEGLSCQSL